MVVQGAGFVVGRFEDGGAAHGGFGGGDEDEVGACEAEKDFPGEISVVAPDIVVLVIGDSHLEDLCGRTGIA